MRAQLKLSKYIVPSDPLRYSDEAHPQRVLFSTRSGATMLVSEVVWRLLADGPIERLPSALVELLSEAELVVPADEDELATIIRQNEEFTTRHDVLYQVVQPSSWCQLGCGYCGQEHTRGQLDTEAQDQFIARVADRLESGSYRALEIGWFGAEPMAGLVVIRRLSSALQELARSRGCDYSARIVTNGLALTRGVAEELFRDHAVHEAEVTLDGPREYHDRRRVTKRGNGSYQRIFGNLLEVARHTELGVVIRCNVDRTNADGVSQLIDILAEAGIHERVRFYTAPVHSWGNDAHQQALSREEYAEWELEWLCQQIRLGFNVGLLPGRKKIVCMAVRPDSEVLDAHGSSYNCTEVSYVPTYGAPNLYAIRLAEGARARESPPARRLATFNDEILSGEQPECGACRMLPVCGGQCPKSWHEGHVPCPSAKLNLPQRLNIIFASNHA